MVPVWKRGEERLEMLAPNPRNLSVLGLGGSVGTADGPIEAPVFVARRFDDLTEEAPGHIVVWNVEMPVTEPSGIGYGETTKYRYRGPSAAAEVGAVASLMRSLTTRSLYTPHTVAPRTQMASRRSPPKRTIRGVLFTNEENGLAGGRHYREHHGEERHIVAIESDTGGGWPLGYGVSDSAHEAWLGEVLAPVGLEIFSRGGGADINPLRDTGIPIVGLRVDIERYFDIHHTQADTLDKIDPHAIDEASAALAAFAWVIANHDSTPPPPAPEE